MPAPYLGGHQFESIRWVSPHGLFVRFSSTWAALYYHQLYAGRTLIGVTTQTLQRELYAALQPSLWPQHLTLLAVAPANRNTDYGCSLPLRPYNRVKLSFATSGYPADAKYLDIFGGTTPGGAVDANNRLSRELFDGDGDFEFTTRPLAGSGTWNFEVKGVDDKPNAGNTGSALAIQATGILAHPPDVQLVNGQRFTVTVAAQQATFSFTE